MCGSISTLEMSITYCTKKKINRTRRRRENRNMKSRLIFTLCSSSSFCSIFPLFQFPSKTNFFATPSFLNAFSRLLSHTPLSKKLSPETPPIPPSPAISSSLLSVQPNYHHQPTVFVIIFCSLLRDVSIPQPPPWKVVVCLAMHPMHVAPKETDPHSKTCC